MVIYRLVSIFFLSFIFNVIHSQNTFLDDIYLLNNNRNKQLLYDSNESVSSSFMIRSTSILQNINLITTKNIIKSIMINYDFQNNSLLPQSKNDGLIYPSRGWQERYSFGINIQYGILDFNYQPEHLIVQNMSQETYKGNPDDGNFMFKYFGMVANNIDNFRQFGFKQIDTNTLGQSRIGFKSNSIGIGYSTENFWWGPGKINSLIFTNNAGGFKHFYLNSFKPINSNLGNFEFSVIIGILDSTKYIDIDQNMLNVCIPCKVYKNLDKRKINALTVNWKPKWVPNLYLGYAFSSQYYANQKNEFGQRYSPFSKDLKKQIIGSIMFRFAMPKDHAEFYGELGLPNEAAYPWKFINKNNPRTGFIFGVNKIYPLNKTNSYLNLNIELTQLQIMNPRNLFRFGSPFAGGLPTSWYLNTDIKQGYSNNGQLLASFIGPGSNSQSFSLSWNKNFNKIGIFMERIVHNNDFYYSVYYNPFATGLGYGYYNRYWVDINTRFELQVMPIHKIILSASFENTNALNYRWVRYEDGSLYDEPSRLTDKLNQQFQLSIKYLLNAVVK